MLGDDSVGTVIKLKIWVEISRVHVKHGYCGACNCSAEDVDGQINPGAGWPATSNSGFHVQEETFYQKMSWRTIEQNDWQPPLSSKCTYMSMPTNTITLPHQYRLRVNCLTFDRTLAWCFLYAYITVMWLACLQMHKGYCCCALFSCCHYPLEMDHIGPIGQMWLRMLLGR